MRIKAKNLQPGQRIRIEYGIPGNVAEFMIDGFFPLQKKIGIYCSNGDIKGNPCFDPEDEVEVIS